MEYNKLVTDISDWFAEDETLARDFINDVQEIGFEIASRENNLGADATEEIRLILTKAGYIDGSGGHPGDDDNDGVVDWSEVDYFKRVMSLTSLAGDTPEDIATDLLEQGVLQLDYQALESAIENAVAAAGVIDDERPDFIESVWALIDHNRSAKVENIMIVTRRDLRKLIIEAFNDANIEMNYSEPDVGSVSLTQYLKKSKYSDWHDKIQSATDENSRRDIAHDFIADLSDDLYEQGVEVLDPDDGPKLEPWDRGRWDSKEAVEARRDMEFSETLSNYLDDVRNNRSIDIDYIQQVIQSSGLNESTWSRTDRDNDGVADFADTDIQGMPPIDHDVVDRLMDIIEEHGHRARFDGRHIVGIAPMTDRHGKAIQDIEKFDATLSKGELIQKVRNWLGY